MPELTIILRDGHELSVTVPLGLSLMEAIRDHGGDELAAICGGGCSCATCHVFVDASFIPSLLPPGEEEEALLDGTGLREATSRLACQISMDERLNGLRVTIAPEG